MKTYEELESWIKSLDIEDIFNLSTNPDLAGWERRLSYNVGKRVQQGHTLSFKQLKRLYEVNQKVQDAAEGTGIHSVSEMAALAQQHGLEADVRHLCLRTAWHDNKWDGNICRDPKSNIYCIGERSLLSERLRTRRQLEKEVDCAGCKADSNELGDYQPPCFWSINTFGSQQLNFQHDNPVAASFPLIEQELEPYSIVSWPFNMSFVRDQAEKEKYRGNYYPKDIFENRIKLFQRDVQPARSIVFTYCNYSNPVSGEESKFLVTGCALLSDQGDPKHFDVSSEELKKVASQLRQPNFPTMNWALRYTLDFEDTGVRVPYHEYLDKIQDDEGITENFLEEIAVKIEEPELRDGFTYVAKHVDDDQAIYLLMKIRRSFLKVIEHGFLNTLDIEQQLKRTEELIDLTWKSRGYLPGLKNLLFSIPELRDHYRSEVIDLVENNDFSDAESVHLLENAFSSGHCEIFDRYAGLLTEVRLYIDSMGVDAKGFLRMSSFNLAQHQFERMNKSTSGNFKLKDASENPYLLTERYVPGMELEDPLTGQKVDGLIDLYKLDIGLLPLSKYQMPIKDFHTWGIHDHRRLRAVMMQVLEGRENSGDCFLETNEIAKHAESYSLFYRSGTPYEIAEFIRTPSPEAERHFDETLVTKSGFGRKYYYLKNLFDHEVAVKTHISELIEKKPHTASASSLSSTIDQSINELSSKIGERFDSELFRAERNHLYEQVGSKSFFVITGTPGSGKSFELLKLIDFFRNNAETHLVLAFTGKAVLRLRNNEEGFGSINAKTIDKFLNEQANDKAKGVSEVIHNLIIDEASMVDLPKLSELLGNIEYKHLKRLILVGDPNQLPPIGFGKPFVDLLDFLEESPDRFRDYIARLELNCRAEVGGEFLEFTRIFANQCKFAEGYLAELGTGNHKGTGIEVVSWESREELHAKLEDRLELLLDDQGLNIDQLTEFLGISDQNTKPSRLEVFQVLSPYASGFSGSSGINLFFQDSIRSNESFDFKTGEMVFKRRDKVMHTQNEYRHGELIVSNGSLGAITGRKKVFFVDADKPISIDSLRTKEGLELAYAITVHKSQGSGFDHVFVVIPGKAQYSYRELMYTALTRAKKNVTIFIQQGSGIPEIPEFLNRVRSRSAVMGRNTSLFHEPGKAYAYTPDSDIVVKSRVEYIIYRKLLEAQDRNGDFSFQYEETYAVKDKSFDIHPDFVIRFADGRTVFWEHLGRVTSNTYMRDWDRRKKIYQDQGDFERVLTTDELHGISDQKIREIIESIVSNSIKTEDKSSRYSKMHYSLR